MKNSILTIAITLLVSFSSMANNNEDPKLWNNGETKDQTFKKGDTIKVKAGSKSSAYVLVGKIEHVCNSEYIKINGYFVAVSDVEVIVKFNTVK